MSPSAAGTIASVYMGFSAFHVFSLSLEKILITLTGFT